jgi:rRNA maturation endonuclease Nob1
MDEKHTGVVREDFAHPVSEASQLTLAVYQRAIDHIRKNTPLAFPKEVAEVYLSRKVSSETECEGCGYSVPAASFRVCPLCGGRLGWPIDTTGE